MIDPEYQLDISDRGKLMSLVSTEGFDILKNIMLAECEKFKVALLNADPTKQDDVLAKHTLAKAAAMFTTLVIDRINFEVEAYTCRPKASDKPEDVAAMLEMQDFDFTL